MNPVFMTRFSRRRPRSRLVCHSFLRGCRDIRQHFETIHRDESVSGPAHLSLLSEPAFLQFQGKLWQLLIPQNTLHGFKISTDCLPVTHVFFPFFLIFFFFFKQHFLGLLFLYSMLREWGGKLEILTSAFSVLILLMRFSCDPG